MRPGQKCTRNVPAKSNKKVLKERFLKWVKFSGSLGKLWLERYQIGVRERSACRIFWVQHPALNRKKVHQRFSSHINLTCWSLSVHPIRVFEHLGPDQMLKSDRAAAELSFMSCSYNSCTHLHPI